MIGSSLRAFVGDHVRRALSGGRFYEKEAVEKNQPLMATTAAAVLFGLVAPFSPTAQTGLSGPGQPGPKIPQLAVQRASFLIPEYTETLAANDLHLARIFGGASAVAAGNGFEPKEMWHNGVRQYRGDAGGRGHLDRVLHLYGSDDGNAHTELYLPPGFRYLGPMNTPNGIENGGHTFYYKKLGTQRNVYLLVFHVKDFKIDLKDRNAAGSVRIGDVGGPGGSPDPDAPPPMRNGQVSKYLHSHLAIQKSPRAGAKKIPFFDAFPTPVRTSR